MVQRTGQLPGFSLPWLSNEPLSFSLDGQLPAYQAARGGPATLVDSDIREHQQLLDTQTK